MQIVIYNTNFKIILVTKYITNYIDWKGKPEEGDLAIYKHHGTHIQK